MCIRDSYNTVDFGVAEHILGSQRDFTRVLIRNASYYPIGKRVVLARSTEIGNISVFHYYGEPADELPLPERFFGGGDSHRGFPEYQAGPRDDLTGFPVGGNALFFNQTEVRFPLIGDSIGGVLFHDMGNIYTSFSHFSFRVHQDNLQDFNYMEHAIGFGIRYRTVSYTHLDVYKRQGVHRAAHGFHRGMVGSLGVSHSHGARRCDGGFLYNP